MQLTGPQRHIYEMLKRSADPNDFGATASVRIVDSRVTTHHLRTAINFLTNHHEALRMKLLDKTSGEQLLSGSSTAFTRMLQAEMAVSSAQQRTEKIFNLIAQARKGLDLISGPTFIFVKWTDDTGTRNIVPVWHHLYADGTSVGIFYSQLDLLCQQALSGQELRLPTQSRYLSFINAWPELQSELSKERPSTPAKFQPWPAFDRKGTLTFGSIRSFRARYTREETIRLQSLLAEVDQKLPVAILAAMSRIALGDSVPNWISFTTHGRRIPIDLDISDTIGQFAFMVPVRLSDNVGHSVIELLRDQRRHLVGAMKGSYIWLASRFANIPPREMQRAELPSVQFNFLPKSIDGTRDGKLIRAPTSESGMTTVLDMNFSYFPRKTHPMNFPPAALSIFAGFGSDDSLIFNIHYCEVVYNESTVKDFIQRVMDHLRELINMF